MSVISLRPYVAADARRCAEIFRSAIDELAADDYDSDQREAWASRADDEAAFGQNLAGMLTLIALVDGEAAGFASLKGADLIEMLLCRAGMRAATRRDDANRRADKTCRRPRRKAPHCAGKRGREALVRKAGLRPASSAMS